MDSIWQNKTKILNGIKNTLVKQQIIEDIAVSRRAICLSCPDLEADPKAIIKERCGKCGCAIKFKTRCLECSCPMDKWPAIKQE